jgi:hypothetical protein
MRDRFQREKILILRRRPKAAVSKDACAKIA